MRASDKENIPKWLQKELPPPPRRERLPTPKQREKSVSLWSIIKECVGKDLSRVCLPVFFNEPLSSLQRIAEEMEYSELLDEVCTRAALPCCSSGSSLLRWVSLTSARWNSRKLHVWIATQKSRACC